MIKKLFDPFPFEVFGVTFTVPSILFLFLFIATLANAVLWLGIGLVTAIGVIV